MQAKKVSEQVRRRLAGNTRSDHLVLLRAYEEWEAARQVHTRPYPAHLLACWTCIQCFGSAFICYGYRSGSNPCPGFWWSKVEKIYSWNFFFLKSNYHTIYLSLCVNKKRPSYRYRRSLQPSRIYHSRPKERTRQVFKFFNSNSIRFCQKNWNSLQ
jgi:hypothetical protein